MLQTTVLLRSRLLVLVVVVMMVVKTWLPRILETKTTQKKVPSTEKKIFQGCNTPPLCRLQSKLVTVIQQEDHHHRLNYLHQQ